jgi:hypothetical protein
MEGRRKILLNAELLCERFSELGRETGISVADDLAWKSEPSVDVVEI